ncbi:MFS transporter [Sciscionella sediminilitoris]|uniref:MFS transporter n=1 Tax=Sciscionella sediminilitoris TaxID=1445613 RepID=UPI0006918F86|nr:MFS transporter [Sciscionella sp. SE31]
MSQSPNQDVATHVPHRRASGIGRVLLGGALGNTMEWFDFLLYGALAGTVFPAVFFPAASPTAALLQSFATYGVGFIARPLGAAWFARISDRVGRKPTMVITLTTMGIASVAIGLIPGYATIGVWAPVALVTLRFVQGFALGGEGSAAMILALEYASDRRRGLAGAAINMGNPGGQVIVSVFLIIAGALLGDQELQQWGWRIPFFFGGLMAILGYIIRRSLEESPAFQAAQAVGGEQRTPLVAVFRSQWRDIVRTATIWAPNTACGVVVTTYALSYMTGTLGLSTTTTFSLLLTLNVAGLGIVPLGGWLSDRFGRKRVIMLALSTSALGFCVFFPLLDTRAWPAILLSMVLTQGAQLLAVGVLASFFGELFPASVRYSGHAAVYTLNNLVTGGPTPFVAAGLLALTGTPWSVIVLLLVLYALGIVLLMRSPETRWAPFATNLTLKGSLR